MSNRNQENLAQNSVHLSQAEFADLRTAFELFDVDKKGSFSLGDLSDILKELDGESTAGGNNNTVRTSDVSRLIGTIKDIDESKMLSFDEFVELLSNPSDERDDMRRVFDLFDKEGRGFIDESDLRKVAEDLGEIMTDEEIQEMIKRGSPSGKVTFEDFTAIMNKKLFS